MSIRHAARRPAFRWYSDVATGWIHRHRCDIRLDVIEHAALLVRRRAEVAEGLRQLVGPGLYLPDLCLKLAAQCLLVRELVQQQM